jgi:uncharacterized BrkB/YihY/UPF0761 family membrane protein
MNANRADKLSRRFLQGLLIVLLCLLGLFPLLLTAVNWFGWIAAEVQGPARAPQVLWGFAFLIIAIVWYTSVAWLVRYLMRRDKRERVV